MFDYNFNVAFASQGDILLSLKRKLSLFLFFIDKESLLSNNV